MPKETTADSSEGGLVRLKYTFRSREKFDEPNDDWLKCIEATSDELLGAYSKAEDNALSAAFGGQGKKMKVLTHRPCYIEPAVVPKFGAETSLDTDAKVKVA